MGEGAIEVTFDCVRSVHCRSNKDQSPKYQVKRKTLGMCPVSHIIKMQFLILCRNAEKGDIHYGREKKHIIYMGFIFLYADKAQRALCV